MWSAQIVIPLTHRRAALTSVVVVALTVAVVLFAADRWGWRRALVGLAAVAGLGLAVEVLGTRTGFPFGRYDYTGALRPTVAGVPVVVTLAWFAMGLPAWATAGWVTTTGWARVAVGAVALTGWDLFLDPQMTREGYWRWPHGGAYRGVPLSNYAGWLAVSVIVMAVLGVLAPGPPRSRPLLFAFSLMCVMETLGFVVFFGDPLVGLAGGAVTLPVAARAWRRAHRG
jgi:putative membrane protein